MVHIQRHAILPYSAEQMFDLVNDVSAYPQFVPYCVGSQVLQFDGNKMQARLDLAKGPLKQSFVTSNQLVHASPQQSFYQLQMSLIEGPFKHFNGVWRFDILTEQASRVDLDVCFEVQSGLAAMAVKPLFEKMAGRLVDAFSIRAKEIYR